MSNLNPNDIYKQFENAPLEELQTRYFTTDYMIREFKRKHEQSIAKLEMMKCCLHVLIDKKIEEVN
jgi:hypothetical protein